MADRIIDLTLADISSDGSGTQADLEVFKDACYAYARAHRISEAEAITAIYGDGDFWAMVQAWGPDGYLDEGEDDELPVCPECHGYLIPLGSLGRVDHFRCRACGADSCIVRGAR